MTQVRLDPRLHPYKGDVAATHLQGQVAASDFVTGIAHRIIEPVVDMISDDVGKARISQGLYGEHFMVYQNEGYWAWGQLETDGYVGWINALALEKVLRADGTSSPRATHLVRVPLTRATDTSIKVIGVGPLPMGAQVHVSASSITVGASSADFAQTDIGAIPAAHLTKLDAGQSDYVDVAAMFLHTPYVWGGRSAMGIDCSALVQLALQQCGIACPRDSDMQEAALGQSVDRKHGLTRGDLVFWPGHVGIMVDGDQLLHANAFDMSTQVELLAQIEARAGQARTVKRIA